eukprot:1502784-Prymnesium_polylepis.3
MAERAVAGCNELLGCSRKPLAGAASSTTDDSKADRSIAKCPARLQQRTRSRRVGRSVLAYFGPPWPMADVVASG